MSVKLKFIELAILEMNGMKQRRLSDTEVGTYFANCGGPWSSIDKTVSWCGIFTAYLLRKAGAKIHWVMFHGLQNSTDEIYIQKTWGNKGISMGDIAIRGTHHFIVLGSPDKNGTFDCVEGNYGGINPWNAVLHHGKNFRNNISNVNSYYKVF